MPSRRVSQWAPSRTISNNCTLKTTMRYELNLTVCPSPGKRHFGRNTTMRGVKTWNSFCWSRQHRAHRVCLLLYRVFIGLWGSSLFFSHSIELSGKLPRALICAWFSPKEDVIQSKTSLGGNWWIIRPNAPVKIELLPLISTMNKPITAYARMVLGWSTLSLPLFYPLGFNWDSQTDSQRGDLLSPRWESGSLNWGLLGDFGSLA